MKIMTVYFFISRHVILRQHIMLRKRIGKINGIKFLRKKRRRKSVLLFYIGMKMTYVMMCHIFLIIKQFLYFAGEKFVLPE